jgi:hypothetical protein
MGRQLALSPFVVLFFVVVWGWIWGSPACCRPRSRWPSRWPSSVPTNGLGGRRLRGAAAVACRTARHLFGSRSHVAGPDALHHSRHRGRVGSDQRPRARMYPAAPRLSGGACAADDAAPGGAGAAAATAVRVLASLPTVRAGRRGTTPVRTTGSKSRPSSGSFACSCTASIRMPWYPARTSSMGRRSDQGPPTRARRQPASP